MLVVMPPPATEAFSERLGVAVRATWRNLRATGDRVPGRVGPLDRAAVAHARVTSSPCYGQESDAESSGIVTTSVSRSSLHCLLAPAQLSREPELPERMWPIDLTDSVAFYLESADYGP